MDFTRKKNLCHFRDIDIQTLKQLFLSAVPGEIYGYWKAHQLAGELQWSELFEPTIRLCEDGFPISRAMSTAARSRITYIRKNKALSDLLIDPVSNLSYIEGNIIKWPNLGRTLRIISEKGYLAVYDGELTPIIVNEINQNGNLENFATLYIVIIKLIND